MKFAVNYSPQAAALLDKGLIEVDLYKCFNRQDMIEAAQRQRPAYVHFPLLAGRDDIHKVGWERIERLCQETDTAYVNTHLAPRASDFGAGIENAGSTTVEALYTAMLRDIEPLVARFGPERVILENAMWDPDWEIPRPAIEPAMIARIITATGCGLLLDLAHARACAVHLGMDARDYITRLPLDCLRELHVTGVAYEADKGRLVDHHPMSNNDWALVEWAGDHIRRGRWREPDVVTLEYGGVDPLFAARSRAEVIARELPRLRLLIEGVRV
jgi:uncharacterized protein (UPF0276 family)